VTVALRKRPAPRGAASNGGGIGIYDLTIGDARIVVLSFDDPTPQSLSLTPAERSVALLVIDGLSNRAIAARRGTTPRTVGNQLASIYNKLGVGSRIELAARLGRADSA
jgi:DNA-binding NarL/FixJ family response regulator